MQPKIRRLDWYTSCIYTSYCKCVTLVSNSDHILQIYMNLIWKCCQKSYAWEREISWLLILMNKNSESKWCGANLRGWNLTACGWLWTISTAFSLLKCSHRPSEANMRKESFGWRGWVKIDGEALNIGMFIGSEILNFALIGSLLYWACFIYTSPMDLETCIKYSRTFFISNRTKILLRN